MKDRDVNVRKRVRGAIRTLFMATGDLCIFAESAINLLSRLIPNQAALVLVLIYSNVQIKTR